MWQSEVEFEHYSTMVKNEFITPIKLAGWCASLNYQNYLILKEIWYDVMSAHPMIAMCDAHSHASHKHDFCHWQSLCFVEFHLGNLF